MLKKKRHFFIIIFMLGLISLIHPFSKYQDLSKKNRDLQEEIKQLSFKNKILYEEQLKLQRDPVYTESVARNKLNVAKEGEVIYKILPEEGR